MNWLLMILSFVLGGLTTWLWSVRTVTRVIPASEYDRHLDARYADEDDDLSRDRDAELDRDGDVDLDADRDRDRSVGTAGAAGLAGGAAGAAALSDRDDDEYVEVDEDHGRYTERDDVALGDDEDLDDERVDSTDEDVLVNAEEESAGAHALGDLDDEVDDDGALTDDELVHTDAEVVDADADLAGDDPVDTTTVAGAGAATGAAGPAAGSQLRDEDALDPGEDVEDTDDVVDPAPRNASDAHTEAIPMVGEGMVDDEPADDLQPVDADAEYADEVDPVDGHTELVDEPAVVDAEEVEPIEDAPYGPGSARPAADGSGPEGWAIKGNADSGLFHTEDSPGYENTQAEVWFFDEESAIAAGFRHWDRKQR
ncbi:hypothetical protein [Kytococcus sedentarius]|uniref:channel accessory protein ArfC, sunset domain variant n=1 Tax=Kytococcus sedentarius TaxID=1276 RepID=UPI0035BBCB21